MAITTRLRSIFQSDAKSEDTNITAARTDVSSNDRTLFRDSKNTDAELEVDRPLEPGELIFEEDTTGGLGRHLGLVSTTFLMYVLPFSSEQNKQCQALALCYKGGKLNSIHPTSCRPNLVFLKKLTNCSVGRIIGTGIFSTPSSITSSVGSVGAALMLWILGGVLSFAGLCVWLELGCMFPHSGREKVYLEAAYKRPKLLATVLFSTQAVLLGFTASGCIVFASNILVAADHVVTPWNERAIAIGVIIFATCIHTFTPNAGVGLMNVLVAIKLSILIFITITGFVVLAGGAKSVPNPHASFRNAFAGSVTSGGPYATALFKVLNSYTGWNNAAYVLNEVKRPVHTLKIAGPLGLGICTILYLMANVSYFSAATPQQIEASGITVASFFVSTPQSISEAFNMADNSQVGKVFGTTAKRVISVFVALSALGNVVTITFAQSRVNQELAKEGVLLYVFSKNPPPIELYCNARDISRLHPEKSKADSEISSFGKFWASNWPRGAPGAGLLLHFIPSFIVIVAIVSYPNL